jgi:hypothetical protein
VCNRTSHTHTKGGWNLIDAGSAQAGVVDATDDRGPPRATWAAARPYRLDTRCCNFATLFPGIAPTDARQEFYTQHLAGSVAIRSVWILALVVKFNFLTPTSFCIKFNF